MLRASDSDDVVMRNFCNKAYVVGPSVVQRRVRRLIDFVNEHRDEGSRILDVGCGGYMPVYLHATHACDISPLAGELLRTMNFKGVFQVADCRALPYDNKFFHIAVCSEVIEHLKSVEDVLETIRELERVSTMWILTTPRASRSGVRDAWNIEESHTLFLTRDDVEGMVNQVLPGLASSGHIKIEEVEHYVLVARV